MVKIISQGAEALIIRKNSEGKDLVLKQRIKKNYRIPEIDEKLRKYRTRSEAKIMTRLYGNIPVPRVLDVSEEKKEIKMEFIPGKRLSDWLDALESKEEICLEIGKQIAIIHDLNVIHGDLTTSNMILAEEKKEDAKVGKGWKMILAEEKKEDAKVGKGWKIYFIDFGLAFSSERAEDKAVDLHLLRQALEAKHFLFWSKLFDKVLEGYKESMHIHAVLQQLKKVEARGRYKSMI